MDEDLIALRLTARSAEEVIANLGSRMLEKGYVKDTYTAAVLEREKTMPTGLELGDFCVAIPHTDSNHVCAAQIAVASLTTPVAFCSMSDPAKRLEVGLVFLLAIRDPGAQVALLNQLMAVFQNVALMRQIQAAKTSAEVKALLSSIQF